MTTENQNVVIVTGLSGAGMSSALDALEDLGYEVLDNFPLTLISSLLESPSDKPLAIGCDTRTRGFDAEAAIQTAENLKARLLFITCDEPVLQKRFTETRRRHPLAKDRPVSAGIKKEQSLLHPLRDKADVVIDTSELSIHDLRREVGGHFDLTKHGQLGITVMSFGYKFGVPREADIVMDVRFLRNPHWEPDLKPLTGQDKKVAAYIEEDESLKPFLENFKNLMESLLPGYNHEGKSYLTLAFGCTGGKHRSVYVVESMAEWLRAQKLGVSTLHRDMER